MAWQSNQSAIAVLVFSSTDVQHVHVYIMYVWSYLSEDQLLV